MPKGDITEGKVEPGSIAMHYCQGAKERFKKRTNEEQHIQTKKLSQSEGQDHSQAGGQDDNGAEGEGPQLSTDEDEDELNISQKKKKTAKECKIHFIIQVIL